MLKKHWFKLVLLALALICAVAVWAVLDRLWVSMEQFEANSEIGAVTEYFNRFAAGDYDTATDTSGFVFDEKNTREDYIRYLKDTFGSDFSDLRFAGRDGEAEGEKLYRIYAGNKAMGSVRLIPVTGQARNWKVISEVTYAPSFTVVAPSFVTVKAGDLVQTPNAAEAVVHEDFKGLAEHITAPTKVSYTVEGYLYAPEISGTVGDTVCTVTETEDGYELTVPVAESDRTVYENAIVDFSKLYARYISEDATFNSLKTKMLKGTAFYESVRTFYNGWYTTHSGYEFRNLTVSDVIRADDNTFAGTVRFDYVVFRGKTEHVYPSAYRLSFVLSDGQWLLGDLKIL